MRNHSSYRSDYIWPRTSKQDRAAARRERAQGKVVGEEYYALGSTQFNSVINKIKLTKPDVIFTDVVGGLERRFLQAAQGGRHRPVEAGTAHDLGDEDEIDGIGGETSRAPMPA